MQKDGQILNALEQSKVLLQQKFNLTPVKNKIRKLKLKRGNIKNLQNIVNSDGNWS